MFLVRSRAALAADELSGAAAHRREEYERALSGVVRRIDGGCCLPSHLVNMPGKERKKKRMDGTISMRPAKNRITCYLLCGGYINGAPWSSHGCMHGLLRASSSCSARFSSFLPPTVPPSLPAHCPPVRPHRTNTTAAITTDISISYHARRDVSMNDDQPGPSNYSNHSNSSSPRPSDISAGKRPAEPPHSQPVLRFQRRTSERAFYEGSYREGPPTPRMDYSAVNPASPWASSPEASRQSFGDGNVSREDLPPPAVSQSNAGLGIERTGSGWDQEQQRQWQPQNEAHAQQQQQQQQQQEYQQGVQRQAEGENRRPQSAARYHGAAPHPAQQRQPQYKLQTKITGLERTGKKDAILRFDVYVCHAIQIQLISLMLTPLRRTFPNSGRLNSATFDVHTPSSRSSAPTSKRPTPRHLCHLFRQPSLPPAWAPTRMRLAQKPPCSDGSTMSAATKSS